MKFGVIVFPGTWSDRDCYHVLKEIYGLDVDYVWHKEQDLSAYDCVILPGGFSYGDYLRCGAVARFSPVMEGVKRMADEGKLVFGICNGFQILCEAGLLPGTLIVNNHLQFRCAWSNLRVEQNNTPFTSACRPGQVIGVPIAHGQGNYFAEPGVLSALESEGRVVFRYATATGEVTSAANPNGSLNGIAGIVNAHRNVLGMMPHPERCSEALLGGSDGRFIWDSILRHLAPTP
ncbi:MAG: phosphoribosylformylglycinamidine synthase subunit PurQ [Chloroflexota bacterium]|nr:MAG: phosphoribosylformylglycinamidine synthase subunit PurQ [Chloroflexota bacterium]